MNQRNHFSRRRFMQSAITATAASGLARWSVADETTSAAAFDGPVIDTHAYIGNWPHARFPDDRPADFVAMLRRNNVAHTWTGSFEGLFHKDVGAVNQRLADFAAQQKDGFIIPFGTVNPTLPDWQEDIRRCHEQFHMRGIRIHPNYHGYTLDDPRFVKLLETAAGLGLVVQLVACMNATPHKWLAPKHAYIDLGPLARVIATLSSLRLVVAGVGRSNDNEAIRDLIGAKQVYFDSAILADGNALKTLANRTLTTRTVFGSCAPLHTIEAARSQLRAAMFGDEVQTAIASRTAAGLISK